VLAAQDESAVDVDHAVDSASDRRFRARRDDIRGSVSGHVTVDRDTVVHGSLQGVAVVRDRCVPRIASTGVRQGTTYVEPGGRLEVAGLLQGAVCAVDGASLTGQGTAGARSCSSTAGAV